MQKQNWDYVGCLQYFFILKILQKFKTREKISLL